MPSRSSSEIVYYGPWQQDEHELTYTASPSGITTALTGRDVYGPFVSTQRQAGFRGGTVHWVPFGQRLQAMREAWGAARTRAPSYVRNATWHNPGGPDPDPMYTPPYPYSTETSRAALQTSYPNAIGGGAAPVFTVRSFDDSPLEDGAGFDTTGWWNECSLLEGTWRSVSTLNGTPTIPFDELPPGAIGVAGDHAHDDPTPLGGFGSIARRYEVISAEMSAARATAPTPVGGVQSPGGGALHSGMTYTGIPVDVSTTAGWGATLGGQPAIDAYGYARDWWPSDDVSDAVSDPQQFFIGTAAGSLPAFAVPVGDVESLTGRTWHPIDTDVFNQPQPHPVLQAGQQIPEQNNISLHVAFMPYAMRDPNDPPPIPLGGSVVGVALRIRFKSFRYRFMYLSPFEIDLTGEIGPARRDFWRGGLGPQAGRDTGRFM